MFALRLEGFETHRLAWGTEGADFLLRETARRLANLTTPVSLVARGHGDRFLVLAEHIDDKSDANILGFARYRNGNDAPSKLIELLGKQVNVDHRYVLSPTRLLLAFTAGS